MKAQLGVLPTDPASSAGPVAINVLFGVPDDGADVVRPTADGRRLIAAGADPTRRNFTLRGSANIAPFLSHSRFAMAKFFLQGGQGLRIDLGPGPILNHIADPDICSQALALVENIARQTARPCFNQPAAVARTTRDGVSRLLAGIPGLKVPKTIRVSPNSIAEVRAAADDARLSYPILARVAGSHGGDDRILVESPKLIVAIAELKREGRPLYLTEFHDFISPDGFYRKFRVVVVGDEIFIRQCIVGAQWSLHGRHRAEGAREEEARLFEAFDSEWKPSIKPVFMEMTRRLGLDYYGADCHIDADRRLLLFEANACMNVMKNYSAAPNIYERPIARIKNALENRLASPETWRCALG